MQILNNKNMTTKCLKKWIWEGLGPLFRNLFLFFAHLKSASLFRSIFFYFLQILVGFWVDLGRILAYFFDDFSHFS